MKKILFLLMIFAGLVRFAFSQGSLNVNLLFHWDDNTLPGSSFYDNTYNEIWGFVQDNREYAVIGSTMGTHIFDVTDPVNSIEADFVPGAAQGTNIVHRDFHDYNGYLYMVADEGTNSTLQIVDLSYLPDSVHLVYDSNALIRRAHNIFIDTATAKLYVAGGYTTAPNNLSVYSLVNPIQPVHLKTFNSAGYVHDLYVKSDTAFLNAGFNGLYIVDFTDTQNPVTINTLTNYPFSGYNHSGWLNEAGNIYVLADETHGMPLKVIDVAVFTNLQVLSTFTSGVTSNSIPHNVIIKEDFAYVSYYYDGLQIFDISDPVNPVKTGFYDTSTEPNLNSYKGAWGVYPYLPSGNILVSDMQNGLYVFDVDSAITGIQINNFQEETEIFPNPVTDILNIKIPQSSADLIKIEVKDISGRSILTEVLPGKNLLKLKIDALSGGIYLLNVTSDKYSNTKKFIVK